MCSSALCTMDDASNFLVIRLGPKTSECEKHVIVMCTVTGCEVSNCATTLHGFNKQHCMHTSLLARCTRVNTQCVLPSCSLPVNLYIWLLYPPRCRNVGSPARSLDRQRRSNNTNASQKLLLTEVPHPATTTLSRQNSPMQREHTAQHA